MHTFSRNTGISLRWNVAEFLQRMFEPLFCIYVYLLVLLPSGSLFGINVKIICFVLLLPPALHHLLRSRGLTARHISLMFAFPAAFAAWIVLSQAYGFELRLAFSQYREILVMFASAWLAAVYFSDSDRRHLRFLQMVLHAEIAACVLKVLLLAYCAYRGISVALLVNSISDFTGANLMGMDFESSLGRIQFIADGLIPLCLYMLLRYRKRLDVGIASALVMFVLLVVSLAFSFSRYLWAFGAVALVLGLLFGKKDRFQVFLLGTIGLLVAVSFPVLLAIAQLRFSDQIAGGSDEPRTLQTMALKQFFLEAPIFGHGFGSYTHVITRSDDLPYVYEVQLLALAGQEGLAGLLLMTVLGGYYFRFLWLPYTGVRGFSFSQKISLTLLLLFWVAAGLLNPTLITSSAAMSYATIKALAEIDDDKVQASALPVPASG